MTDAQADAHYNDAYPRKGGWRVSERGNLTRGSPSGARLTVFQRPKGSGQFAWSIANSGKVRYSRRSYRTESEAADAVWEEYELEEAARRDR